MKKLIIVLFLSICLVFSLNQASWCGQELTRELAKEVIIKEMKLPCDGEGKINSSSAIDTRLVNAGLITYGASPLTPKGAQYFIRKEEHNFIVRTCKIKLGEITGIFKQSPNAAIVEFELITYELTPFASFLDVEEGTSGCKTKLALYDDGWRIAGE